MSSSMKAGFRPSKDGYQLVVDTGQRESTAEFYPADPDVIQNPAPQQLTPTAKGFILDLKKDPNSAAPPAQLRGLLEFSGGRAFELAARPGDVPTAGNAPVAPAQAATPPAAAPATPATPTATSQPAEPPPVVPQPSKQGLLKTVGLAFLGGLLLNLMPCVFPVLFLKGLALVQSGNEERHKLRAHGFVYTAGILVSFWALVALLLGLRAAGSRLGWGFQFQSPVFLSLMAALLFFLGLSLAGQFEIGLTLTSAGGSLASKQGYTGSFFTGVLAVIVATPCTAPFMGAAVGYALAQSALVTFAVFTALALGLAAPYVALTLQPAWTRLLPRPGAWMEVLRQAISVPIFATVIWLAWVLAQAYGAAMLAALLVSFLSAGNRRMVPWPLACSALGHIRGSFDCGHCVGGLSVYSRGWVTSLRVQRWQSSPSVTRHLHPAKPHWEPWSEATVAKYQAEGRPVFVDFTASWCLSCQVNERVALNQPEVQKAFADAKVALLRADWTRHDEAITQALTALDRSGVPTYALYSPGEKTPQVLPGSPYPRNCDQCAQQIDQR